ncbi:MAG: M23 family metallopeptidase [Clostridiales bacterium]|nr:M23 family metallopeptidase [Clostridiales bacterium]
MDVDPAYLAENEAKTSADANTAKESEDSVDANSTNIQAKIEPTVDFGDNSTLTWPVAGTVLIDYSMDSTVYFKTLNVYKYNPALIIGSEVNGQVLAAAKGIVKSIDVNEETGTTITMNIGNNYELVYGQLKEVPVAVGDVVETGSIIGYVSEPTKYYCEEGSNLFFEMKKDGTPVDPFLYLE